jgi:hypothetical protein
MPELAVDKAVGRAGETLKEMAQSASRLKLSVSEAVGAICIAYAVQPKAVGMVRKTS